MLSTQPHGSIHAAAASTFVQQVHESHIHPVCRTATEKKRQFHIVDNFTIIITNHNQIHQSVCIQNPQPVDRTELGGG